MISNVFPRLCVHVLQTAPLTSVAALAPTATARQLYIPARTLQTGSVYAFAVTLTAVLPLASGVAQTVTSTAYAAVQVPRLVRARIKSYSSACSD